MEELLKPLSTKAFTSSDHTEEHLIAVDSGQKKPQNNVNVVQSPEDALKALQSKPDFDLLRKVLQYLESTGVEVDQFNIKLPSPKTAQIVFVLVAEILPDYWKPLNSESTSIHRKQKHLLLKCLSSVSGIGAITARLRMFLDVEDKVQSEGTSLIKNKYQAMEELLEVLDNILKTNRLIYNIWADFKKLLSKFSQRTLLWKDISATLASGKILSLAAEADHVINESSSEAREGTWLGDGCQYSSWLGRNIAYVLTNSKAEQAEDWKALSQLLKRALSLGYTGTSVPSCFVDILIHVWEQIILWKQRAQV